MPYRLLFAVLLVFVPVCGFAHTVTNGPHGGEVEDANPGPMHFETVVKGTTVMVYLSDADGKPMPVAGTSGSIIVLANAKKDTFNLAPTGPDVLSGTGQFADDPNMKALVTLTVSGVTQKALFSMLKQPAQ